MTEINQNAPADLLAALRARMAALGLRVQAPPLVPALPLWLLDDTLPMQRLPQETINALIEAPPYWSFCWGSGQALAAWLLAEPERVQGRTVLDIGSGSGVVAIAAALAGAGRVIACDLDREALQAAAANAALNGVTLELVTDMAPWLDQVDILTAADILYDRDNLPLLEQFRRVPEVLLADSRVRNLQAPGYRLVDRVQATTWPDLSESTEFSEVRLYHAGQSPDGRRSEPSPA